MALGVEARHGGDAMPGTPGIQVPRHGVVLAAGGEDLVQPLLQGRITDWNNHLDAAIEISRHHVGGADVVLRPALAAEVVDARMLEEATHKGADSDPVGEPGNPRSQAADAP